MSVHHYAYSIGCMEVIVRSVSYLNGRKYRIAVSAG